MNTFKDSSAHLMTFPLYESKIALIDPHSEQDGDEIYIVFENEWFSV